MSWPYPRDLAGKLAARSATDPVTGCLLWQGAKSLGYGTVWSAERQRVLKTHRAAWEVARGPIPDGMEVCHRCDVPACINVDHLFLGTKLDNMADRDAKGRHGNMKITHCPKGHPYTPENTCRSTNGRERSCRECGRVRSLLYQRRLRASRLEKTNV